MPATAARYGVDVRDPASSIAGAAHYMSDLTRMFGGNTGLALAGYNWGEGNVSAWLASGANPNAMPAETRNYVQAITGQPIEDWIGGKRPTAQAITDLGAPAPAAGGVQRALQQTQAMLDDQSVPPAQRLANYNAGIKAIKDFREDNIRLANIREVNQKQIDQGFENAVIKDTASDSPTITENQIKTAPDVSPESKMRMLKFLKQEDMPEPLTRVSQANAVDLFKRMNLPDGDPQKLTDTKTIRDMYGNGGLTRADEDWLEKRFVEGRTPEGERLTAIRGQFSKAVEPSIDKSNPLMGTIDQSGKLQNYAFERYIDQKIDEYRKAGKSPFDLFDPSKSDYLGKPEVLQPFQKTLQQSMQDRVQALAGGTTGTPVATAPGVGFVPGASAAPAPATLQAPAVAPRQLGETPLQYMTRIGAPAAPSSTPTPAPARIIMPAPPMSQ
jgi:hypothetical protein